MARTKNTSRSKTSQVHLTPEQTAQLPFQTRLIAAALTGDLAGMQSAVSAGAVLDSLGHVPPHQRHLAPICAAAEAGNLPAVEWLIARGAKLDSVQDARLPLMLAAMNGHAEVFDALWKAGASRADDVRSRDSLLHAAAAVGSIAMLERIKNDDFPLFSKSLVAENQTLSTPLACALANGRDDAALWLVRAGANVNAAGDGPESCVLRWALISPRTAFLDVLLAHPQFDPSTLDADTKSSILEEVAIAGRLSSVEILLKRAGADGSVNALAPLCESCANESAVVDIVALLIEHGAKANDDNRDDMRDRYNGFYVYRKSALVAVLCAKWSPATKQALVTLLLRAGANVAREAVLVAALENLCSVELAQQLVDAGAPPSMAAIFAGAEAGASAALLDVVGDAMEPPLDVNAKNEQGDTLLHFAQLGCTVLARLIDAGADIDARNVNGATPLMMVPKRRERDAEFFLLLERGANPHAVNSFGSSVLHYAVGAGCPERVRRLLAIGVSANGRDGSARTPMFNCVDPESVRLLVAAGASTTELAHGKTPIKLAFRKPDLLRALLSFSGNFARDNPDLIFLCLKNQNEFATRAETVADNALSAACLQLLIDAGASCRQPNHFGCVPLHFAVEDANGRHSIGVLLRNGAIDDLERKDRRGRTPADFAEESRWGRARPGLNARGVDKHDGVMMLVAMGVEPLPTWVEPLSTIEARKRIEWFRFELVRRRATDVLIALQALSLSALEMVHIIEALSPVDCVPFELSWKLATTVKHFKREK